MKCNGVCSLIPIELQFPQCSQLATPLGEAIHQLCLSLWQPKTQRGLVDTGLGNMSTTISQAGLLTAATSTAVSLPAWEESILTPPTMECMAFWHICRRRRY